MTRLSPIAALALVLACRRESPERTAPVLPVPPTTTAPAAAPPGPAAAPPGSAELVPVPKELGDQIQLDEVAHGLARPVAFVVAPADPRKRWFVVEQHAGRIRIIENGKLAPKAFLTVGGISDGNEQGLLGLAFHPQYATNGRLFVNYTDDADGATHIVEYRVSKDPDVVDPASRKELLSIHQPFSNHNGGNLVFGPDGKLYTGMGDGGDAGDPERNGQNPKALLGKILRLDVDAAKVEPERVHLGSRNPWRFSFDAKTGDLYIGDVGQNLWENVYAVAGTDKAQHNFGWNVVEGNHCFRKAACARDGFTAPIADYSHDEGCSVTGGFVYRGKALPMLDGRYFYADYCTGLLRSLTWKDGYTRDHWDWKAAIDREGILAQVSSFGVDADGELYIVELTGSIYRLAPKR
ncbi:MAG: PQQ-dependent sugar dehydrogenase [Myxococcales bacterium]|nr:PQQ-dependent sugar dehydrogenase [Myxococcales bacterium]